MTFFCHAERHNIRALQVVMLLTNENYDRFLISAYVVICYPGAQSIFA